MSGPGYWARLRAAHAAMRQVARAHEETCRELDRTRQGMGDVRGDREALAAAARDIEVGHARSRELYRLVVEATQGIREAMWGRRVDSAALVERAGLIRADPFDDIAVPDWLEHSQRSDAPAGEPPALDDRSASVADDTDTAVDVDMDVEGAVTDEVRPSGVAGRDAHGRVLADWPQYQDAHRIRDPDLDALAQTLAEITAGERERWEAGFDEADDLEVIVTDVHDDYYRERESDYPDDGGGSSEHDQYSDEDIPGDDPDEPPPPAPDADAGVDGDIDVDGVGGEVPDPLEQARRALAEVRLDLIDDAEQDDGCGGCGLGRDSTTEDGEDDQR